VRLQAPAERFPGLIFPSSCICAHLGGETEGGKAPPCCCPIPASQQTRTRAPSTNRAVSMRALAAALLVAWLRAASSNPKHPGDTKTDYYKLLKLKKGFSEKELKTAYRNAAKKYHPDKNPGDEKAAKKFALVAEAHDVLSDPTKRRQYDQTFGKPQRRPQPGGFGGGGFGGSGTDSA
jgi:DnaJ-domain-containing protein 1